MSLYLCVFEDDREIEGADVGSYADFNAFRDFAASQAPLSAGLPTLLSHSDCDGSWSPEECASLRRELTALAEVLQKIPDAPKFTDVDGEPLIERLIQLVEIAIARELPILFQ